MSNDKDAGHDSMAGGGGIFISGMNIRVRVSDSKFHVDNGEVGVMVKHANSVRLEGNVFSGDGKPVLVKGADSFLASGNVSTE